MLVPSRTLYACKRKFLQCEATRSVESSITGVATNNYSMNFNYFATRGGNWPPIPPLDPPLTMKMSALYVPVRTGRSLAHTHTHSHTLTLTHTCTHTYTLTHTLTLTHTHTHAHIHTHSLTHTHSHTHSTLTHTAHSHTHTHTHTMLSLWSGISKTT